MAINLSPALGHDFIIVCLYSDDNDKSYHLMIFEFELSSNDIHI